MKKKMYVTLLALGIAASLTACGSSADKFASSESAMEAPAEAPADNGYYDYGDFDMKEVVEEEAAVEDSMDDAAVTEEAASGAISDNTGAEQHKSNEKIIYTYNYSVETKEFDAFMEMIQKRTNEYGGYVESSEVSGNQEMGINRYSYMVLRVPADKMHSFLDMVKTNSNVTRSSSSSENVTLSYVDMESHLKALKVEQESLLGLLEKAENVEDIIRLQEQLTSVRYEIESYASQLRTFDNRINYSTLYLDINEVQRETTVATKLTYGQEIAQGLSDTLYNMGQGFRDFSIWFIVTLPVLLVWAVIIAVVVVIVRKVSKKIKLRRAKLAENKAQTKITEEKSSEKTPQ